MLTLTQFQIMQNWKTGRTRAPIVSIKCLTYNHEPYIAQTLDGFLMQKTNFPFEVIVHDDASTDRTAEIIREYEKKFPKIIKPIYEMENQYSKHDGSLSRIVNAALKGKYVAMCEGDDYWIDENKLQMQVDFLEKNPEYGLCYTKCRQFFQKDSKFSKKIFGSYVKDFDDLLKNGNRIPTLTVVCRKSLEDKYFEEIKPYSRGWLMGDYPRWLYMTQVSKVKFIDKVTSVYRVLENSASHSGDVGKNIAFSRAVRDIQSFFSEKYLGKEFPPFDEHYFLALFSVLRKNRKFAKSEFLQSGRKDLKTKIYVAICSSRILFGLLWIYKKIR